MNSNPPNPSRNHAWNAFHSSLKPVRQALRKLELTQPDGVDYALWSEAKGSVFGESIAAPSLPDDTLHNCRVLPSRYHLLQQLPQHATGAEIGTQFGTFTEKIVRITRPGQLHLFDLSFDQFPPQKRLSLAKISQLHFHKGDSSTCLAALPDLSLDWAYVDGDHSYEGVLKDLLAVQPKLAPHGLILCNDYTPWSPLEAMPYGIPRAVHEFCLRFHWTFRFLALHPWGYHDIAIAPPHPIHSTVPHS